MTDVENTNEQQIQNDSTNDIFENNNQTSCDFINNVYEPSHKCNKFLLKKEYQETLNTNENNDLYPTLNDADFSLKIAKKREFHIHL